MAFDVVGDPPVQSEPRTPVGLVNHPALSNMAMIRHAAAGRTGVTARTSCCPSDRQRAVADGVSLRSHPPVGDPRDGSTLRGPASRPGLGTLARLDYVARRHRCESRQPSVATTKCRLRSESSRERDDGGHGFDSRRLHSRRGMVIRETLVRADPSVCVVKHLGALLQRLKETYMATHAIYRYRVPKPANGHFKLDLPEGATILNYVEHWHTDEGWTIAIDVLEQALSPRERRWFFLCNAGDNVGFIGEYPDVHYIGSHESKSYISYLFDTSHLSETEREQGRVEPRRYSRGRPDPKDLSTTVRRIYDDRRRDERGEHRGRTRVGEAFDKATKEGRGGQRPEQGPQRHETSGAAAEATATGDAASADQAATG